MTEHIIYSSVMICAVLFLRMVLRHRVPNRLIYALWVIVFIRLVVPGTIFDIPLPSSDESYVSNHEYLPNYDFVPPSTMTDTSVEAETKVPDKVEVTQKQNNQTDPNVIVKTIYIVGAVGVLGWFCISALLVNKRLTANRRLYKTVGRTKIFITDSNIAPCVFGLTPSVYITNKVANSENIDLVLMHEMTHIRHFDNYRAMARRMLVVIYWWNPLVWLYMLLASRDAELACDETVASQLDVKDRLNYAKMIFEYAPRAKSSAAGFGGKPMKKRITCITKNTHFSKLATILALIFSILICAFGFVGCDESTPLPDGVSSLPDVSVESLIDSDTGEIKWPTELLPEGFPKAEYTEIYSAERKDNEVIIVMFAENKKGGLVHYKFENDLVFKYGYRAFTDMEIGENYLFNIDGYRVMVTSSKHPDNHLETINENSPTGYTYEIRVIRTDLKIESLFWQYPDKNTDLGLEEKTFEEWDESIFPENFPKPTNGLTIVSIEQKNNGVFLTLKGTPVDVDVYQKEMYKSGFYASATQPFPNDNGDYFFVEYPDSMMNPDDQFTFTFQICKFNDKVVK